MEFSEHIRIVCGLYHKYWLVRRFLKNPNRDAHRFTSMSDQHSTFPSNHAYFAPHTGVPRLGLLRYEILPR